MIVYFFYCIKLNIVVFKNYFFNEFNLQTIPQIGLIFECVGYYVNIFSLKIAREKKLISEHTIRRKNGG